MYNSPCSAITVVHILYHICLKCVISYQRGRLTHHKRNNLKKELQMVQREECNIIDSRQHENIQQFFENINTNIEN